MAPPALRPLSTWLGPLFMWLGSLSLCFAGLAGAPRARAEPASELPCRPDDTLSEAAAELLLGALPPSPEAIEAALDRVASERPAARSLFVPAGAYEPGRGSRAGPEARARRFVERLRSSGTAPVVCGHARGSRGWLWLAAFRGGSLSPVPGEGFVVELAPGFDSPELIFEDRTGRLERRSVQPGQTVRVPSSLGRPVRIQLLSRGAGGPAPVAQRRVGGGRRERAGADSLSVASPGTALRALRARHGVGALRHNRLLRRTAAVHAEHVCRQGRAAHTLAPGLGPEARLRKTGLKARVVGEVIARGAGLKRAVAGLLSSPSHRLTMVDRRFTDAGWAAAAAPDGEACVVIVLAAWPRPHVR